MSRLDSPMKCCRNISARGNTTTLLLEGKLSEVILKRNAFLPLPHSARRDIQLHLGAAAFRSGRRCPGKP